MRLEANGKEFNTDTSKRLAYTRYRSSERERAHTLDGRLPDDVHTWDTLYQEESGAIYLLRHERVAYGDQIVYKDQVMEMTVEEVGKWNEEVMPAYFTKEFRELMKAVSTK